MLTALTFIDLLGWIYLALYNGDFWQLLLDTPADAPRMLPSVDIIVPARNEADILPRSLPSLLDQDYAGPWHILLIDDHSTDGTDALARQLAAERNMTERLTIIEAPDLQPGWGGKVAAMQAGVKASQSDFILFTDADIAHPSFALSRLVARAEKNKFDLTSLMVKLNCRTWVEKLMVPAFVYFFAMLYPFRRANDPSSKVAAAAGGVMLVRRSALDRSGGFEKIKGTVIDDCNLARIIKDSGGKLCLTLTHDTQSLRVYPDMKDVHMMIARTAYTQLNHSVLLLAGAVAGLVLLFGMPMIGILSGNLAAMGLGAWAFLVMFLTYMPMVRFYGRSAPWGASLPFAAFFYIVATVDSARRHALGRGGVWKGRASAA